MNGPMASALIPTFIGNLGGGRRGKRDVPMCYVSNIFI